MKSIYKQVVFLVFLTSGQVCFSDVVTCVGKVNKLSNQVPNGFFMSVSDSGNMKICDPEITTYQVTPQNCKLIASLTSLAYATGKDLTVVVENALGANCDSLDIPDDHEADISFIGIEPQS
jgi:hypothetical protein